jgi:hypothetical protein
VLTPAWSTRSADSVVGVGAVGRVGFGWDGVGGGRGGVMCPGAVGSAVVLFVDKGVELGS